MRARHWPTIALPAICALLTVTACTSSGQVSRISASPSSTTATATAAATATPATPRPRPTPPGSTPVPSTVPRQSAIPPVSPAARADGLLDVRTIVPDAIIDLHYATKDNFTHVQLYPADARCLVHESMATGLATAARVLRREGARLVFWDCYRPHAVQVRMFQVVPDPDWVARPGPYATSHESGRSVDVTLAYAATGRRLDMGTGFDDFTPRAHAYASAGLTAAEIAHRATLRNAMAAGGLTVYSGEWWHFDGPGSFVHRPILAAPVD